MLSLPLPTKSSDRLSTMMSVNMQVKRETTSAKGNRQQQQQQHHQQQQPGQRRSVNRGKGNSRNCSAISNSSLARTEELTGAKATAATAVATAVRHSFCSQRGRQHQKQPWQQQQQQQFLQQRYGILSVAGAEGNSFKSKKYQDRETHKHITRKHYMTKWYLLEEWWPRNNIYNSFMYTSNNIKWQQKQQLNKTLKENTQLKKREKTHKKNKQLKKRKRHTRKTSN